jgi:hypothetical protein
MTKPTLDEMIDEAAKLRPDRPPGLLFSPLTLRSRTLSWPRNSGCRPSARCGRQTKWRLRRDDGCALGIEPEEPKWDDAEPTVARR